MRWAYRGALAAMEEVTYNSCINSSFKVSKMHDPSEDKLERERRQESLRRYIQQRRRYEEDRPSLVCTLIALAVEFYIIKNLFFVAPYSFTNIAIGIIACLFFLVYHFPGL